MSTHRLVRLKQAGMMRSGMGKRPMNFSAAQSIDLTRPQFVWRAATGPLSCLTVVDSLIGNETCSEVRLLGLLRVAGASGSNSALLKGQIMRYLAELPWAPDAILSNTLLDWKVADRRLTVSTACGAGQCTVTFSLDDRKRIVSVSAVDRPRMEEGRFAERPWQGHFADYRRHYGRLLPFKAEVGWVLNGTLTTVWQGAITGWEIV